MNEFLGALKENYVETKKLPDGRYLGVAPMVYTTGLFVDLDEVGYNHRYCYASFNDALNAMRAWDGTGEPSGPWIKRKGLGHRDLLGPGATEDD